MKTWMLIFLFSTTIFANTKLLGPEKVGKSDSGIRGVSYEKLVDQMQDLVNKNPQMAERIDIGISAGGTQTHGVLLRNKNVPTKKLFLVTGATHGNEYLNIVDRLMVSFLDIKHPEFQEFFNRGGAFFVLPVFNPDGYSSRNRYNDNMIDLNRDYSNVITDIIRFRENETSNMKQWLEGFLDESEAKFALSMDYHCCYRGALLFPWGYTKSKIPQVDRNKYNEVGEMMKKHFTDNPRYGAVSEIIWYLADGTSHDYYYANHGALAMTYEGRYSDEADLLPEHIKWWKDIVSRFGL